MIPEGGKGGPDALVGMNYPHRGIATLWDISIINVKASKMACKLDSMPLVAARERDAEKTKKWEAKCKGVGMRFVNRLVSRLKALLDRGVRKFAEAEDAFKPIL